MSKRFLIGVVLVWCASSGWGWGQVAAVVEIENDVQIAKPGGSWKKAALGVELQVQDRIRTRRRSRAVVRLTDLYMMRLEQFTTIELSSGLFSDDKAELDILGGAGFLFSREQAGEIGIKTPTANAAMRGTQLFVRVEEGRSFFQVIEGAIELWNPHGRLVLAAGQAGEARPGRAPQSTAVIEAKNILQWALYYPAVLDPAGLEFTVGEERALGASLAAYRSGDLLGALEGLPDRAPAGHRERLYQAAIVLAVGRVDEARRLLAGVPAGDPDRRALERMIAAVRMEEQPDWPLESLTTVSEALAESYYQQSIASRKDDALERAHAAAERATELAPENGYAWTRLAELEFSFGRNREAKAALAHGLALMPRNAQAHALQGFILAGENCIDAAKAWFEAAIRLDGGLGNGWLGLGLAKIKSGNAVGGRRDLQTAATVEPNRSILQSYLGKALSAEGLGDKARESLDLARELDEHDPTPLLYSAIENQRLNRTNRAIGELQDSILLNENRRVYRSRFLLDQDRAVRSANLASIFQNAGMNEVAVREATRAVENDYTNPSAHLFLANAFDGLRDPTRIELRYETPWFNELLLANLLSPVGGGPLSQYVSQQEYSRLLEADGLGASFISEWRSDSEWRSTASVYGTFGRTSFGIDASYRNDDGDRLNNDDERLEVYAQLKHQVSADDVFYFLGKFQDQETGDTFKTYDNLPTSTGLRFEENQEPGLLLAGWNHRWRPGSNTLFLGGRLSAEQTLSDPRANQLLLRRSTSGMRPDFIQQVGFFDQFTDPALAGSVTTTPVFGELVYSPALLQAIAPYIGTGATEGASSAPFDFFTHREFEIYTAELQHIEQRDRNTLLVGGRIQSGKFETDTRMDVIRPNFSGGFSTPAAEQHSTVDFDRTSLYAYDYWSAAPWLTLIGGVSWDRVEHPVNFRNPPVSDDQREDDQFSGKLGFTLTPASWLTVRGVYTEAMGGVTFDESVRLEPVQLAGFNQAYRTVLSESIAGSVETPEFTIYGLSVEGTIHDRTWWGLRFNAIGQDVERSIGAFSGYDSGVFPVSPAFFPDTTPQLLDYDERSFEATINRLVGEEFAAGALYRVTQSELRSRFPEIPTTISPAADLTDEATLHEVSLYGNWNSPTGLHARIEANWYSQDLEDDPNGPAVSRDGDNFWQLNAMVGYRFNQNQGDISVGVLNITDADYRLSPLNPYGDIARERTVVVRCRMTF